MPAFKPQEALPGAAADADSENITADICVIGAGPGGLAVAAAAAAFGRSVVLIERHKVGGDALNYGCIPSKALAAAANRAHAMRTAATFGIAGRDPEIDPRSVNAHVQSVIAALEPNFAAERFVGLGVRVIRAAGRFINKKTVVAGEYRIKPGDVISVFVFSHAELSAKSAVLPDGSVSTPLVQSIKAVGLTPIELKVAIEARLKEVIDKPNVTVMLEPINVERR